MLRVVVNNMTKLLGFRYILTGRIVHNCVIVGTLLQNRFRVHLENNYADFIDSLA